MNDDKELVSWVLQHQDINSVLKAGIRPKHVKDLGGEHFQKLLEYHRKYGQIPTVDEFSKMVGEDPEDLLEGGGHPLGYYVDRIKDRELELLIRDKAEKINAALQHDRPREAIPLFRDVAKRAGNILKDASETETMPGLADELERLYVEAETAEDGVVGYKLPWDTLNKACSGHIPGDFIVFVGKAKSGKTFLLGLCIIAALKQEMKTLVISTEQSNAGLSRRLCCLAGKFNLSQVRSGNLPPDEKQRYLQFLRQWDEVPLVFGRAGKVRSVEDLELLIDEHQPDIVAIDSLYKFRSERFRSDKTHENIKAVVNDLRDLLLEKQIIGIVTHHYSKDQDREKAEGNLDNLSLAHIIGWEATHVYSLVGNKSMLRNNRRIIESLAVREGQLVKVPIHWLIDHNNFSEIEGEIAERHRTFRVG